MTAVDDRPAVRLVPASDLEAAHRTIASVWAQVTTTERQLAGTQDRLAEETEWAETLRSILALAPYATRPNLRGSLEEWVARRRPVHESCPARSSSTCRCPDGPNRSIWAWRRAVAR